MKEIKDFPKYFIDEKGFVISRRRRIELSLKPTISRGYLTFFLYIGNYKYKHVSLHRLLASQFIPNPDNKPCVNHKDGNKLNNNLNNLEWCTYSENNKHAYKLRLMNKEGSNNQMSKLSENDIYSIRYCFSKLNMSQNKFSSYLSQVYPVSSRQIRRIISRTDWRYI